MAPDPPADQALPPQLIAQAEAAIASNAAEENTSRRSRPSRDYSKYQEKSRGAAPQQAQPSEAPPAYNLLDITQDGFDTKAKVTDDGRVNIRINQKTRRLSDMLVPALRKQLALIADESKHPLPPGYIPPALGGQPGQVPPPRLNVVIHVVGSRGDVQPFVALGKTLKETYGHRVRLATHPTFQTFVEENGLEFFSIGGDPAELMAFMVKNPGLMPGLDSLKSGDVGKRRKGMEEIVLGCWRSCIEAGNGLGARPKTDLADGAPFDMAEGMNMDAGPEEKPFIADAIIANPPSFAHIHIAEKLGIPLHMMFTMPWSPTQSFPHPLANIQSSNADVNMTNFISYALVEMMTWQGLGDIINRFREKALGLDPISLIWAPGMLSRLRVPYTYCWSPALIPKPKDWGQHISISGFYFLSLASSYTPEPALAQFLAAGPPPVYIGFGSIVVDDPDSMTKMIFEAVKNTGVRALVSKGWGGLGADALGIPDGVFMLGNVPHDWLFKHVSCVVHHGGAGTTAAGISLGCPTVVVPFFGDQPFWGAMVARAGAGPSPIPFKQLTADNLSAALIEALKPETLERAKELGAKISQEKGSEVGGKSFHDMLECDDLRCSLAPSRVAVWSVKRSKVRLSALAATVLADEGLLNFSDLKLYRPREYETDDGPWEPITGGASAVVGTFASLSMGVADFPVDIFRAFKKKSAKAGEEASTVAGKSGSAASSFVNVDAESTKTASDAASLPPTPSIISEDTTLFDGENASSAASPFTSPGPSRAPTERLNQAPRSKSRSRSRGPSPSSKKDFDPSNISLESALGASKGLSRIVGAGLKSPMDFTLGIARGFHNAPKLYGDDTVRKHAKVTDFQSGLKAAGKEFGYGLYDGISGLVTQPIRGAEKEGAAGLFKGIGKGIGGLVLKPGAAVWGLPGYTFMGIHKEILKVFGSGVSNYIIAARTAQGYEEWKSSTPEERRDIIARWNHGPPKLQSQEQVLPESGRRSPKGFFQTRHLSFDERKKLREDRRLRQQNKDASPTSGRASSSGTATPASSVAPPAASPLDFEAAIRASVASTSRSDPEEDRLIERAIRASVRELQTARGSSLSEQEALERAIAASVAEAGHGERDAYHVAALEKALHASMMQEEGTAREEREKEGGHEVRMVDNDPDTDDDENMRRAIEESKQAHARSEEEIVLEYVKKQSLAEEEHRQALLQKKEKGKGKGVEVVEEGTDEDLQRAMRESLRGGKGEGEAGGS